MGFLLLWFALVPKLKSSRSIARRRRRRSSLRRMERGDFTAASDAAAPDELPLADLVVSTDEEEEEAKKVRVMGARPRGPPIIRRVQRKKLLILDLNGLLVDINQDYRNSHFSLGMVRGKLDRFAVVTVFKRPYCDDFLRFCIRNFELAIWSSRLKANTDAVVDILMKDLKQHLLFCWDASKCTATGHYTLENKNKPLVLKELKKLWNKEASGLPWQQGEFSPSNTLLVDDSPYKALRNPPHTAIFPYSYSYKNVKDDSLGPGGDLRLYLEELAGADDVQRFVEEHPFGQLPITERNPNWTFYAQIRSEMGRRKAFGSQGFWPLGFVHFARRLV